MLIPFGESTRAFIDYVFKYATVRVLTERITFKGHKTPNPIALCIVIFDKITSFEPSYIVEKKTYKYVTISKK